jgi:integrase
VNYAKGLGRVYKSNRTEKIWEDSDVEAFLRHATPEMALALRLALDTAQRQGDLVRLTWGQFRGGAIELRQNKGDKPIYVPCTQLLVAELQQAPKRATTILTGRRGRPWTEDGFRTEWRKIAVAAGIQGRLTFHDLRGTAITRLAEAGCAVPEIATVSGHSVTEVASILEAYLARTNRMAHNAIAKLEDFRKRNRS